MKISLDSIRISIAGARLSHLVQKDRIWDHGSMTEQARIIFYLVQKAKSNGSIESLKKYMTISCFQKLEKQMSNEHNAFWKNESPVITELAVMDVHPGKGMKADMFTARIKGYSKDRENGIEVQKNKFSEQWSFVRQGEWWMLDRIKTG